MPLLLTYYTDRKMLQVHRNNGRSPRRKKSFRAAHNPWIIIIRSANWMTASIRPSGTEWTTVLYRRTIATLVSKQFLHLVNVKGRFIGTSWKAIEATTVGHVGERGQIRLLLTRLRGCLNYWPDGVGMGDSTRKNQVTRSMRVMRSNFFDSGPDWSMFIDSYHSDY